MQIKLWKKNFSEYQLITKKTYKNAFLEEMNSKTRLLSLFTSDNYGKVLLIIKSPDLNFYLTLKD
jgi:hypothetical protein